MIAIKRRAFSADPAAFRTEVARLSPEVVSVLYRQLADDARVVEDLPALTLMRNVVRTAGLCTLTPSTRARRSHERAVASAAKAGTVGGRTRRTPRARGDGRFRAIRALLAAEPALTDAQVVERLRPRYAKARPWDVRWVRAHPRKR